MGRFEKQIVLITGPKGGLGSFVTEAFLNEGARVVGVSKSIQASDFPNSGFTAMPADLSNSDATRAVVEEAVARYGRIDILAHIAGGFAGGKAVAETDDATWDKMMNLNVRSAFNILRAVIPHMRSAGHGRIVAIGGRAGVEPAPGIGAYSVSKAALATLVRTVALENKDFGITANVILPGTMDTPGNRSADPQADRSRWVPPAEVAELVLYLASDAGAHMSGAAIPIYGRDV